MSDQFDPYYNWLGIEPHEMPADHYRLLGISRFENDPAVIVAAADARMSHVRMFQTGPRAPYTQRLLNELAAAKICLVNPGSKASYDQLLVALATPDLPPSMQESQAQPAQPTSLDQFAVYDEDDHDQDEGWTGVWIAVGVMLVLVFLGVGIVIFVYQNVSNRKQTQHTWHSQTSNRSSTQANNPVEDREPILLYQEADGSVNLDASFATLQGPSLTLGISGAVNVITDWESMDDQAIWKFKVVKVPPQGIFHVHVTYAARPESDGGSFVISVGDQEKECEIRGEGQAVTDEYFIAVPASGDYTLTVRAKSKPAQRLMTLQSIRLAFPTE